MPSKILILLVASCLVWIALISLALVAFSGLAISAGWIAAGALVFAVTVWGFVMSWEIRRAVLLPDFFAEGERGDGKYDIDGKSTVSRPRSAIMERAFTGRRVTMMGRHHVVRPRKLRTAVTEFAGPSGAL